MNLIVSQALATGMPVLATAHSGLPEQVIDGVTGALVPETDVAALADKLRDLVDHPEVWPALGRAGREHVERHYDAQKLVERQIADYERLRTGDR